MTIIHDARAIMATLQPLTGTRATGNVTVNSSGPPATLKGGSYGVPVVSGSARYDRLVKVGQNPASTDGWPITTGTVVPCFSNIGGVDQNVPAGSTIRWFPTLDGIEPVSVTPAGLSGAAPDASTVGIAQLVLFEDLAPGAGLKLLQGGLSRFPAAVLAWDGSGDAEFMGRAQYVQQQLWSIYLVVSRQDADPARRMQGLLIMEAIQEELWGRQNVDGESFSTPNGAQFVRRMALPLDQNFYLYRAQVTTKASYAKSEHRAYGLWQRTKLDMQTDTAPPLPLVTDNEFLMQ